MSRVSRSGTCPQERDNRRIHAGLTQSQLRAIQAEGNVLVEAGAGTGKTSTLVGRVLQEILHPEQPVSITNMLMVTFTEAAAAEMRHRIRKSFDQYLIQLPGHEFLASEIALLDTACIGTLHSFCFQVVREHFHELGLDPNMRVMDDAEARLLARELLENLLHNALSDHNEWGAAVHQLLHFLGRHGHAKAVDLVLALHRFSQTLVFPEAWLNREFQRFEQEHPAEWEAWILQGFHNWATEYLPLLQDLAAQHNHFQICFNQLQRHTEISDRRTLSECLAPIVALDKPDQWPKTKTACYDPNAAFFKEAVFLHSLCPAKDRDTTDPLQEDWDWIRKPMNTLIRLAREFQETFRRSKRQQAALDFHDLEQFTVELLWDSQAEAPSAIAKDWQNRFHRIFVDEYQDINEVQDRILQLLSREDSQPNRFLVGDVKQSIYRFRLADPNIFLRYREDWKEAPEKGSVIPLTDNFRSHEGILSFVNLLFDNLMTQNLGGVNYDADAWLRFGVPDLRGPMSIEHGDPDPVEVHFLEPASGKGQNDHEDPPSTQWEADAERTRSEREAQLIAARLKQLKEEGFQVRQNAPGFELRPVEWNDMVILLRAPSAKAESFAKIFDQAGIPLECNRGGFFESMEIRDLLSLLQLLDNPLQDIPCLAVLRSPLVGLHIEEMAVLRPLLPQAKFWFLLHYFHRNKAKILESEAEERIRNRLQSASEKIDSFLLNYLQWRELARLGSLSQCLEGVLAQTHYEDWLKAQDRGEQRLANLRKMITLARQFDQLQAQGLFKFLRYVESQQEEEFDPEPAAAPVHQAVRLMSVHKSKGLEFPVVVVADLAKPINRGDLQKDLILDREMGCCPVVRPPNHPTRYPSAPHWLAARQQKRDTWGEEIRLFYVATTRASQKLILTGSVDKNWKEHLEAGDFKMPLRATRWMDWLIPQMTALADDPQWFTHATGSGKHVIWAIHESPPAIPASPKDVHGGKDNAWSRISSEEFRQLADRLQWKYPLMPATREPAKTSVSAMRKRTEEFVENESQRWFLEPTQRKEEIDKLSAADIGVAHHRFLQYLDLSSSITPDYITAEAQRMFHQSILSEAEADALNLEAIHRFWNSPVGLKFRNLPQEQLRREWPFTARFGSEELTRLGLPLMEGLAEDEFVVVQGVLDLVAFHNHELWILDFKTDRVKAGREGELETKYRPQLSLYAAAMRKIYRLSVTHSWLYFLHTGKTCDLIEGNSQ